jgi:serpin B
MKRYAAVILMLLSAVIFGLLGCAPAAAGEVLKSDKPRDTSPVASDPDVDALVDGNNAFAFALYQVLKGEEENLFYSPYSISEALAMTYAGARDGTEASMADALHFTLPQARLHPAFNWIDLELAERGEGAQGKDSEGFRLHVVNAIWGQAGYTFLPEFLDVLSQNYGAGLRILDFVGETEPSRVTINEWVADQTEQRIKDLIPEGAINELTRLVLTNAIYFNAAWKYPFKEEMTTTGQFKLLDGTIIAVPMMRQDESMLYAGGAGYQAVELPYDGGELSMVIILPADGQFEAVEGMLSGERVKVIIAGMEIRQVDLTMPRFEFESSLGLKRALSALGMGVAFTEDADFSGISGKRDLLIQDVLHKAFVSVDEAGTEAAAATAVIVGTTSMPELAEVKIDRPFIFFIRDIETGSIIFIGRVLNPTG